MSIDAVSQILEHELATFWTTRTKIFWDNVDFLPVTGLSYIRPTIDFYDSDTISSKCQREYHLFTIQVFTPPDIGSANCDKMADDLVSHFFNFSSGYLNCKKLISERVGSEKEWYQRNVLIEVEYDNHF